MSSPPPTIIRAVKQSQSFELQWEDSPVCQILFHTLRAACPCATCIDEFTGAKLLDPDTIPADIAPVQMGFIGNYALKITWSDGHSTGLYTWDLLADLAGQQGDG